MLATKILSRPSVLCTQRGIASTVTRLQTKETGTSGSKPSSGGKSSTVGPIPYKPTDFDKWVLVWMKKYPKGQVPDRLDEREVYHAKSRARIKFANYMMVFGALIFVAGVINGKLARNRGDTVHNRIKAIHEKRLEEGARERAAAAAAAANK